MTADLPESSSQPPSRRASTQVDGNWRSLPPPAPAGPRSPRRAGSQYSQYSLSPSASLSGSLGPSTFSETVGTEPPKPKLSIQSDFSPVDSTRSQVDVKVMPVDTPQSEHEVLPTYDQAHEYRSPEAVVEPLEDSIVNSLPPGVLAEHLNEDDIWIDPSTGHGALRRDSSIMDVDNQAFPIPAVIPDRPQIGPGVMAKRWLQDVHPHMLYQPVIRDLPAVKGPGSPRTPTSPSRAMSLSVAVEGAEAGSGAAAPSAEPAYNYPEPHTLDDVWEALPGGRDHHQEWYFCPACWGWLHVVIGKGKPPPIQPLDEEEFASPAEYEAARSTRYQQVHRLSDISTSRATTDKPHHHFHEFKGLVPATREARVERVIVPGLVEKFAHMDDNYGESPESLTKLCEITREPTLYVSCASQAWVFVDKGLIPGQLAPGLVKEFTHERKENPPVGIDGVQSVVDAWALISTLLINPLFRNKRGWVRVTNKTYAQKIGATLRASHLLYQLGFGCREEGDGYRVGPLAKSEKVSDADVHQMDRYMIRAWVEVSLYLQIFQRLNGRIGDAAYVDKKTLREELDSHLDSSSIPELNVAFDVQTYGPCLDRLGVAANDTASTIEAAYSLQVSEDYVHAKQYLGALDKLSHARIPGVESLQLKVATERSLDRYTEEDVDKAYDSIGVTNAYVDEIMVTREEIPANHILEKHREALDSASDPTRRQELSRALMTIGKERNNEMMIQLGREGRASLSLDQAYKEFNLTKGEPIDCEMLLLQFETFISDRPSRDEHYRTALSIIANAPGEERPELQAYLSGKDISELQGPVRRDLPTGLKNIGNTCYLNSVLQFMYAIKPVRDAVTSFAEPVAVRPPAGESAKDKEKRIKAQSSRRFVILLRELFEQMYNADTSAVTPTEELARLAILPVDLISEREGAIPAPKPRVTIDSLPTVKSPIGSPMSSGAATLADTAPPTPLSPPASLPAMTPPSSPPAGPSKPSPTRRPSVLGKRASQDRDSAFGGSEEHIRRRAGTESTAGGDVEMLTDREDSQIPAAGLLQLELASPRADAVADPIATGIATPAASPPAAPAPLPAGPPPLPPRRRSMALVAAEKFGLQQDAAEILINVLAQLEYALEGVGEGSSNLISSLFSAKFRQQMLLQSAEGPAVESHPPVESVFVHPIIGVEEDGKDLYDCLAELYLGGAEVEYEGKKGFKMDLIDELPPMLYIQMRRSQYDAAKGRQTKTNTHVPFDGTLVMDRFLANADSAKRERSIAVTRDIMRMRARRHELKNHKPMSIPDTFRFVKDALGSDATAAVLGLTSQSEMELLDTTGPDCDITPDLLAALGREGDEAEAEIAALEAKLPAAKEELEALWTRNGAVEYELVSVFMHGGTGTGGHYWTYQADLPQDGDKFFYYSDDNVKDAPSSDVFSDKSAQGVSPALLCYVRKDRNIVDTLHRAPAPEVQETEPTNGGGALLDYTTQDNQSLDRACAYVV